jgi:hypothetical protein
MVWWQPWLGAFPRRASSPCMTILVSDAGNEGHPADALNYGKHTNLSYCHRLTHLLFLISRLWIGHNYLVPRAIRRISFTRQPGVSVEPIAHPPYPRRFPPGGPHIKPGRFSASTCTL